MAEREKTITAAAAQEKSIFLYRSHNVSMPNELAEELRASGFIPVGVETVDDVRVIRYPEMSVDGDKLLEAAIKAMAPKPGKHDIGDVRREFVELLAELMFTKTTRDGGKA
jgi:hypothetical protein